MPERAATRPFWSGTLTFGLVSVPVELVAAVHTSRVSLRTLGPEGQPLRRRYVRAGDGSELDREGIVRGIEVQPGSWVTVTDEELEALEPEKTREIDLRRFVPRETIDPLMCDRPYFLLPDGEVTKAYRLLAQTMEQSGRAGVASFVLRGRESLIAIFAENGILHAETLRHDDEVRGPEDVGLEPLAEAPKVRIEAMAAQIDALAREDLDRAELSDERAAALRTLAEGKPARDRIEVEVAPTDDADGEELVDVVALLRERLGAA